MHEGPQWLETEFWSNELWQESRSGDHSTDSFPCFYRSFKGVTKNRLVSLTVYTALVVENIIKPKSLQPLLDELKRYKVRCPKYTATATTLLDKLLRPEWIGEEFWSEELAMKYLKKYNNKDDFCPAMKELLNKNTEVWGRKAKSQVTTIVFMMNLLNPWMMEGYPKYKRAVLYKLKEFASDPYYGEMAKRFLERLQ